MLRGAIKKPLATYLSEKIWSKYGMDAPATWWLASPGGNEIGGSGFSATLRDYARFGLFIMNGALINGQSILPEGWLAEATPSKTLIGGASINYGYCWWIPPGGPSREAGAFYSNGIEGQNISINPKEKLAIVMWGAQSKPGGVAPINTFDFFDSVVAALK